MPVSTKKHLSVAGGFTACGRRVVSEAEFLGERILGLSYRALYSSVVPYLDQVTCVICLDSDEAQKIKHDG